MTPQCNLHTAYAGFVTVLLGILGRRMMDFKAANCGTHRMVLESS